MWFSWFDKNSDGKVSIEDLDTAKEKLATLRNYDDKRRESAIEAYTTWWKEYVMWGKSEITKDEFIEHQKAAYEADKEAFYKRMLKNQKIVGSLLDEDGDGFIDEKDYVIIFKSAGHSDDVVNKQWFNAINPVDGKVAVNVNVATWTNFLTCDDSSKPDVFLQQFEAELQHD